jgi:rhodanese-related sulfurtransferase
MIDILGIIQRKSYLDFSRAKTAIIFCNGSWCSQSPKMILRLINLGYPRKKLLWYRGGMQDWVVNGFTVVKDN